MSVGFCIKAGGTLVELVIPWILSYIIDDLIPLGEIGPVCVWGGLMIVCSLLAWIGNIAANRMASAVARDCTRQIRHDLFRRISYLSEKRVDQFTIPSLISRMTSDTYVLHQTVGMIQRLGVRAPILLVGGVMLFYLAADLPDTAMSTICAGVMGVVGLMMVHQTAKPYNKLRIAMICVLALGFAGSFLFLKALFNLVTLDFLSALVLAVFALLAWPVMNVMYKLLDKLSAFVQRRKKMRRAAKEL